MGTVTHPVPHDWGSLPPWLAPGQGSGMSSLSTAPACGPCVPITGEH